MNVRNWFLLDATDVPLGRLSTAAVRILQGKGKVEYAPNKDIGDYVVVTNAEKIRLTGKKLEDKLEYRHSGYPGGDKYIIYKELIERDPERIIKLSISGMLPKNRLRKPMLKRLKVFRKDAKQLEEKCQKIKAI